MVVEKKERKELWQSLPHDHLHVWAASGAAAQVAFAHVAMAMAWVGMARVAVWQGVRWQGTASKAEVMRDGGASAQRRQWNP